MFTKSECEKIINYRNLYQKNHSKKYFKTDKISYHVWNILKNQNTNWIFEKIFKFYEETTKNKIIQEIEVLHLHHFIKGDKFPKHRDTDIKSQVYNIGVCLNEDYSGGDFILYDPYTILPKKTGTIYGFESAIDHEVTEIQNGERWSLICFLHYFNIENRNKKNNTRLL
jgi:predicted 2-oxoglutarate/Fe(II)-dependent dioxygenase YbiX